MARNKNSINVDSVSFTKEFISSHKSAAAFIETMNGKTYGHLFVGENREAKLKDVYAMVNPPKEAPKGK